MRRGQGSVALGPLWFRPYRVQLKAPGAEVFIWASFAGWVSIAEDT